MDAQADDNFFIEEPHKLRNNFFNKDRTLRMVELIAHKQATNKRLKHLNRASTCGSTPDKREETTLKQDNQQPILPSTLPKSFVAKLDLLCPVVLKTDDLSLAKQAVDTLVSAFSCGSCFLEKYIVVLLNFCTRMHEQDDEALKIKVEELLNRILTVDFSRQQLAENLRRPDYKLTSLNHIIYLLRKVEEMLDHRESKAVDWLHSIIDAYFVELATTEEAEEIVDKISAHISSKSALLREAERTKCILRPILEQLDANPVSGNKSTSSHSAERLRFKRPHALYTIEYLEI